jgi:hypothetical protein
VSWDDKVSRGSKKDAAMKNDTITKVLVKGEYESIVWLVNV